MTCPGPYEMARALRERAFTTASRALSTAATGRAPTLDSDPNNCGACGNVCPASAPYCDQGRATVATADVPRRSTVVPCGGACVDIY